MAIDIEIKQSGIIKRELNLQDITAGKYRYGVMDEYWRLDEGSLDGENIVFYNPEHIGRGVEITWRPGIKDSITIRLPLPTTAYDVDMCFDIVRRICKTWKAKSFVHDGEVVAVNEIDEYAYRHKVNIISILESMEEVDRDNSSRIILCAKFPLKFNSYDLYQFGKNGDLEGFANLLHSKQVQDLYYAVSRVYRMQDGSYFGAYAIGANIDSIIPIKPEVPLMMKDPVTGEDLKCDKFVVMIGSSDNPDIGGNISYEDFADGIGINNLEKFDENHVILRDFSEEMVKDFASKYPEPLK
ncbi:MAG: DUF4299 family protein [Lachnospiraceae bacterium]|nr:DUF4299 family protein [Lachnospiraceae bacterium]